MKKNKFIAVLIILAVSFNSKAQQQAPLGRFIIGTSPFAISMSRQTGINQNLYSFNNNNATEYSVQSDSVRSTSVVIKAHISLFVGYFLTKNICAGLQFGANSTGTYSTFIRYYLSHKNPDSAKFDFFFQANGTLSFNSIDNPAITNYYPFEAYGSKQSISTSDYKSSQNAWNIGIGLAFAYHLTRHWALEAEVAFLYSSNVTTNGSYVQTTNYYSSQVSSYTSNTSFIPSLKNTLYTNTGALRFMLSYRI
jgi:hypothetical protein